MSSLLQVAALRSRERFAQIGDLAILVQGGVLSTVVERVARTLHARQRTLERGDLILRCCGFGHHRNAKQDLVQRREISCNREKRSLGGAACGRQRIGR